MDSPLALSHDVVGPDDGHPVVLLHGFPFDRTMWRFQVTPLTQAGCRVLVPDLRGHGKSDVAPESSIEAMAADVAALMERVGMPKATIVGFSMGGYVALQLAVADPTRVLALALLDTRAEPDSSEAREKRLAYIPAMAGQGSGILVEAMMGVMLTDDAKRNRRGLADLVRSIMARQPLHGLNATLRALADRPDQRPNLGRIACPTLIMAGQEDPVTPPPSQAVLASGIRGAELVLLPRLAHGAPLEGPDAVNRVLLGFLAQQKARLGAVPA